MTRFLAIVRRDVVLSLRATSDLAAVVLFFVVTGVLFPFAVGPEARLLARIAAGVVWVAALLATLLALDRMFREDWEDGSLERIALSPLPLEAVSLAKALAHWLVTGVPLILVSPLLAAMLSLPADAYGVLLATLVLGTPSLSLIGGIGSALILGARRSGALLGLLVLPLFVPTLIFAVLAVEATIAGAAARPHLLLLGAILAAALPLAPIAAAAALRQAMD